MPLTPTPAVPWPDTKAERPDPAAAATDPGSPPEPELEELANRRRILIVGRPADEALRDELHAFSLIFADGSADPAILLSQRVDVVFVSFAPGAPAGAPAGAPSGTPEGNGPGSLGLLREVRERWPDARRVVFARHDELPELLAETEAGLVHKVLPRTARPDRIRKAIGDLLFPDERSVSLSKSRGLDWMTAEELLRWTAVRLTQVRGVVVRALDRSPSVTAMQFVLLQSSRNEQLRKDLLARWLWPLKPRDAPPAPKDKAHPLLRRLGRLSLEAEVYAQRIGKERAWLWVALLPWRAEPRLTAVLGIETDDRKGKLRPELRALVSDAHHHALDEVTDFPLPGQGPGDAGDPGEVEQSGVGQPLLEYDWIATPDFVGPDRRRAPTTFLNRYVLVGRRRRVPSRLRNVTDSFADRLRADVWWHFGAYLPLALVDTVLTFVHVRSGAVTEMNPLLRPLVLHAPWAFVAVKNALALLAFFGVARFQWFGWGLSLLRVIVALYLALDLYWLALLWLR